MPEATLALPTPIRPAPRYLHIADRVPTCIRAHGLNTLPAFFRFSAVETPYFWSRARGLVFLAALLMKEEISFSAFFEACQEMLKSENLHSKYSRSDHLYRNEVEAWLKARPRVSDAFFGPRSIDTLIREITEITMSRLEGPVFPSGQLTNLRMDIEDGTVFFQADNLGKLALTSKQHGMQLLGWWVRTQQMPYEALENFIEQLFAISNTTLPFSPA